MCFVSAASDLITQGPVNQTKIYSSASATLEDVTFRCEFYSSEDISIQWLKSTSQLFISSDYMISTNTNCSTLTIFNVTTSDIDAYTCSVNTSNSSDAITAYLQVVGKLHCSNLFHFHVFFIRNMSIRNIRLKLDKN